MPKELIQEGALVRLKSGTEGWIKGQIVEHFDVLTVGGPLGAPLGAIYGGGMAPGYKVYILEGKHKGETIRVPENYVEPIGHAKPGGEPLYPHVPKSRQPLFPHVPKGQQSAEKLPQTLTRTGTCYADAWRFLIKEEEGELIHGTLFSGGRRMGHAWVETLTGWVWEPETGKFFTVSGFKDAFAPVIEARYNAEEAAIMAARTKNLGPWSEQERLQYLGVRQPMNIGLLASTEGDPIRKFCCRQCGECAPTELLEEGKFLDRISWLRNHYKEKHPGMWGKRLPLTLLEDIEPVSPEYRHLVGLVSEPLPKEAD